MKKIGIVILLCVINVYCFSQNVQWKVIRETEAYDGNFNYVKKISSDTVLEGLSDFIYQKYDRNVKYDYLVDIMEKKDYLIDAEAVIPNGTKDIFAESILTPYQNKQRRNWYNINYVYILQSKKRDTAFQYSNKALTRYINSMDEYDRVWYEYRDDADKTKIFQVIIDLDNYFNGADFYVLNIEKKSKRYELQAKCNFWWMHDTSIPESLQPSNGDIVVLTVYQDGDYLDIYLDNRYLIGTYVALDEEFEKQFANLMETNTCDLTNVTFPRRADKNHTVGVSCIVAENLRLRKEESTSSATLQTMQTGTTVKILQLGKKQTIDGITANWVQVELSDGTKGWCFGGYLVEK